MYTFYVHIVGDYSFLMNKIFELKLSKNCILSGKITEVYNGGKGKKM